MDTRKGFRLIIAAGAAIATGLVLFSDWPAISAGAIREVGIEKRTPPGTWFFKKDDTDITIKAGDTVEWVAESGHHQLLPDSDTDAFTATGPFDGPNDRPTQVFDTASDKPIHYHCRFHRNTMKGSIKVEAADK
jgi:plastocyanin